MARYYLNVRVVRRSAGRSVIAAAGYCSRSKLRDEYFGGDVDFSTLRDLQHSEILLPSGAPDRWLDRAVLWNEVEAIEKRANAQLAVEVEAVIPHEISGDKSVELTGRFAREQFIANGKVVDLNIQLGAAVSGPPQSYALMLLPMREISEGAFAGKADVWHGPKILSQWRTRWSQLANSYLIEAGYRHSIDTGANAASCRRLEAFVGADEDIGSTTNLEIAWRNGERLLSEPDLALEALTRHQSSFDRDDLTGFVKRNTSGNEQYRMALARIESSVDLVRLSDDERFSTRRVIARLQGEAQNLAESHSAGETADSSGNGSDRALEEALPLWEAAGRRVRGVGLTYEFAKAFEKKTGVKSVAVHGLLGRWMKKQDLLASNDVLVVNDVAKLTRRQKEWMLKAARAVKAKLVFVDGARLVEIDGGAVGLGVEQLAVMGA